MAQSAATLTDEQIAQPHKGRPDKLPKPTPEDSIASASPDTDIILWRGISLPRVAKMISMRSLSGEVAGNVDAVAPGEDSATSQVGKGKTGGGGKLPEFTTNMTVANAFGRGGVVVVIAVKRKYLYKGSGSEGGWVTNNDAPFEGLMWIPGEKPIFGTGRLKLDAT